MNENETILTIKGLSKGFPGVQALSNVDFSLKRGEIHALMGENGAGKSTVIKVLTGVYKRDAGEIIYEGRPLECTSPLHAQQVGISPVYQEVNLVPNLSVAENIFLGRHPMRHGHIDWKTMNRDAADIIRRFDMDLNVEKNLGEYAVAIQQMVAIARALELKSKIIILDEPTSSLNVRETKRLFIQMRRLRDAGQAVIFITHFIDQVYEVSDTITVLRNGAYIGTWSAAELNKVQLISRLLGKETEKLSEVTASRLREKSADERGHGPSVVESRGLSKTGGIKPFDVQVAAGEVLGCAGLLGSGRTEVANLFFGIDAADQGTLLVEGQAATIRTPRKALQLGLALSPEDRKEQGIIGDLSVRENIILALQNRRGWLKTLSRAEQQEIAERYIELLNIKTPTADQAIKNLSGGNQQKVIIARWLAANPKFLILDEPTRGIDVGAKTEIQKLILELSEQDMAVMFISSELEEIARCSTKVMVMHDMQVSSILEEDDINEQKIMSAIAERHTHSE
jgi:simple sugar transport system ATP-binding protein